MSLKNIWEIGLIAYDYITMMWQTFCQDGDISISVWGIVSFLHSEAVFVCLISWSEMKLSAGINTKPADNAKCPCYMSLEYLDMNWI